VLQQYKTEASSIENAFFLRSGTRDGRSILRLEAGMASRRNEHAEDTHAEVGKSEGRMLKNGVEGAVRVDMQSE